ncbi:hypothetical protein K3495_g14842 [Podosphaera aphanis]|nr:hypothetical protein K3495_g14842 [Podosphaera aphanis]
MGQQQSKRSGESVRGYVPTKDVVAFLQRLKRILSAPSYSKGVDPNSVIEMLDDLVAVYFDKGKYVRVPKPMNSAASSKSIKFACPVEHPGKTHGIVKETPRWTVSRQLATSGHRASTISEVMEISEYHHHDSAPKINYFHDSNTST